MTAMAATAEELELQNQVTRALESQGVLGKIKAQLRAAVFQTIHSARDPAKSTGRVVQSSVVPATAVLQSLGDDAPVALELVRNFLECLELDHTLAVFLAEVGLDDSSSETKKKDSEWRLPARLCARVRVSSADEATPVLVKMLRGSTQDGARSRQGAESRAAEPTAGARPLRTHGGGSDDEHAFVKPAEESSRRQDLPPPAPAKATPSPTVSHPISQHVEDDDGELEASMAEEVASGSFEEESLAESAGSMSHSQGDAFAKTSATNGRPGRFGIQKDDANDDEDELSPAIASPPPVPAKLGPLPSLPGMGTSRIHSNEPANEADDDEEEEAGSELSEPDDNDDDKEEDELDEDAAAARLRSLEEQLKEMEAADATGVLQQLKATERDDDDDDRERVPRSHTLETATTTVATKQSKINDDDDDDDKGDNGAGGEDDNYGSDFEEEVEEEEADVASELSEDIASMSMLSESEDVVPLTKSQPSVLDPLTHDKAVESEDALNSYDYIEAVERH